MKRIFLVLVSVSIIFIFYGTPNADLIDGLVAYYPFNGNANDKSGNGYHGTVNGAVLRMDRFGNTNSTYSFDGDDYIGLGNTSTFNFERFSLAAWVNFSEDNLDVSIVCKPLISKSFKKQINQVASQPSEIEEAYTLINYGLDRFTQAFSLAAYKRKNENFSCVFNFLNHMHG